MAHLGAAAVVSSESLTRFHAPLEGAEQVCGSALERTCARGAFGANIIANIVMFTRIDHHLDHHLEHPPG
jgi:hypothetical protein